MKKKQLKSAEIYRIRVLSDETPFCIPEITRLFLECKMEKKSFYDILSNCENKGNC